jgi:hypothetical protein
VASAEWFILKESIIQPQWNCKTTGFWTKRSIQDNFLLIMHEHLFVFRKPAKDGKGIEYQDSSM